MLERDGVQYNRHHVWYERCRYTVDIEKKVRNMGAFVIRAAIPDHNELHANTPPPPKPNHDQLYDLYQFMQEHGYEIEGLEGLEWGIVWANDRRLYDLEENLTQQHFYLSGDYKNGR